MVEIQPAARLRMGRCLSIIAGDAARIGPDFSEH